MENTNWGEDSGGYAMSDKKAERCEPDYGKQAEEVAEQIKIKTDLTAAILNYVVNGKDTRRRKNSLKELYGYLHFEVREMATLRNDLIARAEKQQKHSSSSD